MGRKYEVKRAAGIYITHEYTLPSLLSGTFRITPAYESQSPSQSRSYLHVDVALSFVEKGVSFGRSRSMQRKRRRSQ